MCSCVGEKWHVGLLYVTGVVHVWHSAFVLCMYVEVVCPCTKLGISITPARGVVCSVQGGGVWGGHCSYQQAAWQVAAGGVVAVGQPWVGGGGV